MTEIDELLHLWPLDQRVEGRPKAAAIAPTWRGGQTDQLGVGIGRDDLAVGPSPAMMGFVNEDDVGMRPHLAGP